MADYIAQLAVTDPERANELRIAMARRFSVPAVGNGWTTGVTSGPAPRNGWPAGVRSPPGAVHTWNGYTVARN